MEFTGRTFADVPQVVDGNKYFNCTFERCAIAYRGGEIPHMMGCSFADCTWHFEDAAQRTLGFLHQLYHGTGDNGRLLIEQTIDIIRQPDET